VGAVGRARPRPKASGKKRAVFCLLGGLPLFCVLGEGGVGQEWMVLGVLERVHVGGAQEHRAQEPGERAHLVAGGGNRFGSLRDIASST